MSTALLTLSPDELRVRREAAGLSIKALASRVGVSEGALRHWESGRKPIPEARTPLLLQALAGHVPANIEEMSGVELRALRERYDLPQEDLAHLLGVTQQAVATWEAGAVPERRREVLREAFAGEAGPRAGFLRALRKRAGWTQAELAQLIGWSQAEVSQWELGHKPIPNEQWPRIRDLLLTAEPDIRPVQFEQPFTADELHAGVKRLGWTLGELAQRVGVARGTIGPWASGAKPIPPERWRQFREVLGTAEPARRPDPDAAARTAIVAIVTATPGLLRQEAQQRAPLSEERARKAIAAALTAQEIHESPRLHERGDGVVRRLQALYPGPAPGVAPDIDMVCPVVDAAIAAARSEPGRTRRQIAMAIPHDRRLGEKAIARAIADGALHERAVVVQGMRGRRARLAVFPGPAPPAPAEISGEELRQTRTGALYGQKQFADMLGVSVEVLRRWESDEVPEPWRDEVAERMREIRDPSAARQELQTRVLQIVESEPGMTRWGDLPRHLRAEERPLLRDALEALIAGRQVHERVVRRGTRGVGLFAGPPPVEWEPGPTMTGRDLREQRTRAGVPLSVVASAIGAGVSTISAWENERDPIPRYRRAQLRRFFAGLPVEVPPAQMPEAGTLRAERMRVGWTQADVARAVGTDQATVSAWERGRTAVPLAVREQVMPRLAALPDAPRVEGPELRTWRLRQALTLGAVAQHFGVSVPTIADWERRGVSRAHVAAARALIDDDSAQADLFTS